MLSITSAWIPSTFTALFTTTKSPAASRKSSNSERKSKVTTAATFHPTNIISAPLSSTRLIVKPQTQPLLAPLVGPMTVAEYYEDEEEDTSEEIVGEKMEEKETSSAEKETSISVRSSSSQEVTTITRAPFVSITTAYPSLFTPAAPSSELSPLLLTNTPRLPFALLSRSSPPQHHRRPAFHYDALHHSTSNPLPIEQESEHYLPGFADLSSLRRVSPDAEPKSSRFSKRRREQMRAKSRKEGMLRRDTVVKQADMVRRRREQERREREEEEKERAVDLLLSLAWRV
ncbi:hypothetical protein BCR35DRAFT_336423 [Leucosporidium creatinivorum]|uniref:Uncharacterized protein n=1 Tax=Leucosporidium creatinivorum TaxID=106004 RepID=A0A1Y2C4E7_9BASI|nr:hypothetical protein BCR35DRAFT_336423 [Leucosporidium creatinivorum]